MSKDNEFQLLASFFREPSLICRDIEDLFIGVDNLEFYRAMMNVLDEGERVDIGKVVHFLGGRIQDPVNKICEMTKYLAHMDKKYLTRDVRWCIKTMREEKVRRELATDAKNEVMDFTALREKVNSISDGGLDVVRGANTEMGLKALLDDLNIPEGQKMYSGFVAIDKATGGWRRGDLVSVMARPSVGKTWILLNIAHRLAERGFRISFFSLEGSLASTMERIAQIQQKKKHSEITPEFIEQTVMRDSEFASHYSRVSWHNQIYSVSEMAEIYGAETPDVVFVDFLGLVKPDIEGSPYEKMSKIIRDLKAMAIEKNILLIYANQISRLGEDGTVPVKLNHARDTGQAEELTDFIIGAWRPEMHATDFDKKYKISMELLKCKRGETAYTEMRLYQTGIVGEPGK